MNPSEYQRLAARTECDQAASLSRMADLLQPPADRLLTPIRLNHAALGAAGEVGELARAVERWIYYGRELDRLNVKEELGDILWYIALACNALGFSLEDVMQANIRKLQTRYPDKYTDTHATIRDAVAEAAALGHATALDARTPEEVLRQRGAVWGCCNKNAANQECDCLQRAQERATRVVHTSPRKVVQDGHGFGHLDTGDSM